MKLLEIASISLEDTLKQNLDVIIVASGYESRARSIAKALTRVSNNAKKIAFGFAEYRTAPTRIQNDRVLKKLGFQIEIKSAGDGFSSDMWVYELLENCKDKDNISILIDISAMSRTWYGGIIKALRHCQLKNKIQATFAYTPTRINTPKPSPPNEIVGPVFGYSALSRPNLPTALILGLGNDPGRALGLNDFLDPQVTICFYPKPGIDTRYEKMVSDANTDLFEIIDDQYIMYYDIFDVFGTFKKIESVCQGLIRNYRVVLASLGPKIFSLYCFLLNTDYPEISVWRVSPAMRQLPVDLKPSTSRIFVKTTWTHGPDHDSNI
jgi:hypothetical protein